MSDTVKADYHGLLLRSETGSQRDTKILSAVSRFFVIDEIMAKKKQKTPTIATADRSVLRVSTLLARDAFITETITITLKYITRAKT